VQKVEEGKCVAVMAGVLSAQPPADVTLDGRVNPAKIMLQQQHQHQQQHHQQQQQQHRGNAPPLSVINMASA
jgi:hypothetical protein